MIYKRHNPMGFMENLHLNGRLTNRKRKHTYDYGWFWMKAGN